MLPVRRQARCGKSVDAVKKTTSETEGSNKTLSTA